MHKITAIVIQNIPNEYEDVARLAMTIATPEANHADEFLITNHGVSIFLANLIAL